MPRATIIAFAFLFGSTAFSIPLVAQDNIEDMIERDSAGFVVIQEPSAILHQIESSVFFENRYYLRAMEILADEKYALVSQDRMQKLENQWYEIRDAFAKLNEISIIVHSWEGENLNPPKISVVLSGPANARDQAHQGLSATRSLIVGDQIEAPKNDSETDDFFSGLGKSFLEKLTIKKINDLVLISNAPEEVEKLVKRIESTPGSKFRSLSKNRSYLQIQNVLDKRAKAPQIRGYVSPERFSVLMSSLIEPEIWRIPFDSKLDSLAGAGFQILLQHQSETIETPEGSFQPIINWDFVAISTQPATGYGKLIEAFEPIHSFPSLPFAVTSLSAKGFDLSKHYAAREEIAERDRRKMAQRLGDPEDSELDSEVFGRSQKDRLLNEMGVLFASEDFDANSILEATDGKVEIFHEANTNFWEEGMILYHVNDPEAMMAVFLQMIEEENFSSSESSKMVEVENEYGRLFTRSETAIREHLETTGLFNEDEIPESGPLGDKIMSQQYEYFINDEWMIKADHLSMVQLLRAFAEDPEPQAFELLLESSRMASGQDSFYRIGYRSHKLLENSLEENRIWDKAMDVQLDEGALDEEVDDAFHEAMNEAMDAMDREPDEFGLRMKLESPQDANAAVQQLLFNAFTDTFGTAISLYSQDEHRMRIFGQVFSFTN